MKGGHDLGEGLLRLAMHLHPRRFRGEYAEEMLDYYRTVVRTNGSRGRLWRLGFLIRSLRSAVREGSRQRLAEWREAGRSGAGVGRGAGHLDTLRLDVRYGIRSIVRRPGFALAVIGVLALGMGANTAVFSVLNAVLLRPLPYPAASRLVRIYEGRANDPGAMNYVTAPAFADLRDNGRAFEALAALYTYSETGADLTGGSDPVRVRTLGVTAGYFDVLGLKAVRGREFGEDDASPGVRVAMVSATLAESRGIRVGGSVDLDGVPVEVVGVFSRRFEDPVVGRVDVLLPLEVGDGGWEEWQWDNHYLTVLGKLRRGSTLVSAGADVERRFEAMNAVSPLEEEQAGRIVDLHEDRVGNAYTLLVLLMGAVLFLLLVACVNVAGLFMARSATRERELAVRTALGSPRWRVVRQLVIESALLSVAGALAGLLVGRLFAAGLTALAPADLVGNEGVPFDLAVFGFSAWMAAVAGMSFGIAPALVMTRTRIEESLRRGGRGGMQGERASRSRDVLVVAQLSLSLVLLVGAALLVRSFDRLRRTDLGFQPGQVYTFEVNLPSSRYDADARIRFHRDLEGRLEAIDGVRAVGAISHLPVTGRALSWGVRQWVDGPAGNAGNVQADQRVVQGAYFDAVGIPVLAGRLFDSRDDASAPPRVVINESLARRLFPDGRAIGRRIRVIGEPREVIGVVGDVAIDARGGVAPIVYHSHLQFAGNRNWVMREVLALDRPASGIFEAAKRALAAIDPALVLYRPGELGDVIDRGTAREWFATLLLAVFAGVAVLLAAVGVYAVLAWSVSRRRHEFGVRVALGARAVDVRRMVVGKGVLLLGISICIGLVAAIGLSSTLSAFLFGVGERDAIAFAAACVVIIVVALAASWAPAVSATRVDPAAAFRSE